MVLVPGSLSVLAEFCSKFPASFVEVEAVRFHLGHCDGLTALAFIAYHEVSIYIEGGRLLCRFSMSIGTNTGMPEGWISVRPPSGPYLSRIHPEELRNFRIGLESYPRYVANAVSVRPITITCAVDFNVHLAIDSE